MEITELIENFLPSMSKGHKAIANYILESYDKAAYMTAARLGEVVGVSESTVVRFTTELGYEGYPEFQRALKEELKSKLTSVQRLDFAEQFSDEGDAVSGIMSQDIQNLKDTLASIDEAEFKKAVNSILNAGKIYIMGIRASAPLSEFMHFYLTVLFDDVVLVRSTCTNELFEQILPIGKGDVMIGISYPRYSARTINCMKYARQNGATTIAITDRDGTAMTEHSDIKLLAKSSMASFVDSLTAPLSLINALLRHIDVLYLFCGHQSCIDSENSQTHTGILLVVDSLCQSFGRNQLVIEQKCSEELCKHLTVSFRSFHCISDYFFYLCIVDGLLNKVIGAEDDSLLQMALCSDGGSHNYLSAAVKLFNSLESVDTGELGHNYIHKNEIGLYVLIFSDCFLTIGSLGYINDTQRREEHSHLLACKHRIVADKYFDILEIHYLIPP